MSGMLPGIDRATVTVVGQTPALIAGSGIDDIVVACDRTADRDLYVVSRRAFAVPTALKKAIFRGIR